jgi:hypothetical protein
VAERVKRHGIKWLTAQAIDGEEVLDRDWLRGLSRATKQRDMRLGVHGYIGRPHPKPAAEAKGWQEKPAYFTFVYVRSKSVLHVLPSSAISHRPVIVLPSSENVPVNRCEKGSPSRHSFHTPSPRLIL